MTIGRILDNNLITSHRNHILIFDLPEGESAPEVEYVCDVFLPDKPHWINYQYLCKGAHHGGAISLIVFGIEDVWDDGGLGVDWKRIEWADDRTECNDALILDTYQDLIFEDIRQIICETWD